LCGVAEEVRFADRYLADQRAQQGRLDAQPFEIRNDVALAGQTHRAPHRGFGKYPARGRKRHAEFVGEQCGDRCKLRLGPVHAAPVSNTASASHSATKASRS
jgi:hypothetical protein